MSLHDLAVSIAELNALRAQIPWYYVRLLDWTEKNGVLKAVPKKPLSDAAHKATLKAFKKRGGAYVSHNGKAYYELVTKPRTSHSTSVAEGFKLAMAQLEKEG